ncbi:hypothetical protein [Microlunatus sp. GCM10028923]|uniref:hypothetical protein n=1 Tax=Microlunatus sp. GCM10028923 TaxID=3273400 RepID=UPI00360A7ECA
MIMDGSLGEAMVIAPSASRRVGPPDRPGAHLFKIISMDSEIQAGIGASELLTASAMNAARSKDHVLVTVGLALRVPG